MSDETTMLPCPFCGGTNLISSYHSPFIVCEDCGAFGPGSADSTHDEAIAAWNTRATLGSDQELIDLAHNAWSMALCAMQGMPIPAKWGDAVERGLLEHGIDVDGILAAFEVIDDER